MKRRAILALALCVLAIGSGDAWGQSTTRVSVATGGVQVFGGTFGYGNPFPPAVAGARFVAFAHSFGTLVPNDTNGRDDVFLHDRFGSSIRGPSKVTTRVSLGPGSVEAGGASSAPAMSADGRFVAFVSTAANLVAGDSNGLDDVFMRDRASGTTTRVSVGAAGVPANGVSHDPAISADGRFVAFDSTATNLVANDTNATSDVFVRDLVAGTTTRASLTAAGGQANGSSGTPALSADGRFVAFGSAASNLVAGDTNGANDVFVRDRTAATTTRASLGSGDVQASGDSAEAAISGDGNLVAFKSAAANLVTGDGNGQEDIFVHDRAARTTVRASVGPAPIQPTGPSFSPRISAEGRFVTFLSSLPFGSVGLFQVFVHDLATGDTTLASVNKDGTCCGSNGRSFPPGISADGRFVAFGSGAINLVDGDTNNQADVFLRDRGEFAGFRGVWERVTVRCPRARRSRRCSVAGRLEVTNPGNRTARSSRVSLFLSRNGRLDARDRRIRRLSLARLKAGKRRTVSFRRALARDPSGRLLIARLDATNRVKEPNERDNVVVSAPLSRKRIRLAITGSVKTGRSPTITVTVTDASSGHAIRGVSVSVSGAGLGPVTKRSGRRGAVTFRPPGLGKGILEIRASRRGYATATVHRRVR